MVVDVNTQLSDFAEILLGHTFRGAIEEDKNGEYSVLQAKNLDQSGTLSYDFVQTSLERKKSRAYVKGKDVILSNRGTFRAGLYEGANESLIASSSVYLIRIQDQLKVLPEYLVVFLGSKLGQTQLESINSGTLIRSLPKGDLVNMKIPIPSIKNQKMVVDIQKNHRARNTLYEKKAGIHKDLTDYAIYKLITS